MLLTLCYAMPWQVLQPDNSIPFSSGQNNFSRFTMDMVRQYMKEEEVRAQHQSSLLQLRQRALKDKTRAELAWLEHLKRHGKYYTLFSYLGFCHHVHVHSSLYYLKILPRI